MKEISYNNGEYIRKNDAYSITVDYSFILIIE